MHPQRDDGDHRRCRGLHDSRLNTDGTRLRRRFGKHDDRDRQGHAELQRERATKYSDPIVYSFSYSGFKYADTAAVVSGTPACTTTGSETSAPGSYPISCTDGTLSAANYLFNYTPGSMTVTAEDAGDICGAAVCLHGQRHGKHGERQPGGDDPGHHGGGERPRRTMRMRATFARPR